MGHDSSMACCKYFKNISQWIFIIQHISIQGTPTKHGLTTNNCRIEGIEEKKLFREPLRKGYRCVVICDGFYEWKTEGKKVKQPYFISFPQPEGVWKHYKLKCCTNLTKNCRFLSANQRRGRTKLISCGLKKKVGKDPNL